MADMGKQNVRKLKGLGEPGETSPARAGPCQATTQGCEFSTIKVKKCSIKVLMSGMIY